MTGFGLGAQYHPLAKVAEASAAALAAAVTAAVNPCNPASV